MNSRHFKWFVIGTILLSLTSACSTSPAPINPGDLSAEMAAPTDKQSQAVSSFGEKLFGQIASGGETNPVISPLSIFYALGMAGDGAAAETAAAFEKVFGMSAEQARRVAGYLLADLATPGDGTVLTAANSVWLDNGFPAKQEWVDRLTAYYQAEVFQTSLSDSATATALNSWISEKTNKLIPTMLDRIDPGAMALLVNALYMKAAWQEPFNTDKTYEGQFWTADGDAVEAVYMSADFDTRQYFNTDDAEGVVIPYQDGRLAFVAALPKQGSFSLDGQTISGLLAAATSRDEVSFYMPKFETEFGADLVDALSALGLGVAFTEAADFSGISDTSLLISQVAHKVNMAVGEKGTEAAAATVVIMVTSAPMIDNPIVVEFNRPYLYAVVDQVTGLPLFIGMMDDPAQAPPAVK